MIRPEDAVREEEDEQEQEQEQEQAPEPEAAEGSPQEPEPQAAEPQEEEQEQDQEPEPEPDPLAEAERKRDEYLELARRTQADFENYRKRTAKDVAAAGTRAKLGLVRDLLPVVDNLERALASAEESEQHLAHGVRLVHSELVAVLQRNGVEPFDPSGEPFDPEVHEALSTQPADGADPGTVVGVMEKGYKLNGTVLRPARVVVSA